jgi:shikimate dehydrogenase
VARRDTSKSQLQRRQPRRGSPAASPVTGRTKILGIFGDPVDHSSSPAMHNAALRALGLDYVYVAFHVRPDQLATAVAAIRALDLAGINVTVPHKQEVARHLDSIGEEARRTGAVNTITNRDGTLHGDNTDVAGFAAALREAGARVRGRRVVVIGAGGAARAALVALGALDAGQVVLVNRTGERAAQLARDLGSWVAIEPASLADLRSPALLGDAALVVNTTSLGLHGERFPALAASRSPHDCVFFDMVYGRHTDFLRRARAAQRTAVDGSAMLLHQGARAFRLWTKRAAPLAVMRAVLELRKSSIDKARDRR